MSLLKNFIKKTPLINIFILVKMMFKKPKSQNDEDLIIERLVNRYRIPQIFIEFGFSGWEFNCARLAYSWSGLLIDGNPYNIKIGKYILPKSITVCQEWLTLDNLDFIRAYAKDKEIGVLSIDVDGNDYWFWEALIDLQPAILIAEYNSTFGLRPITVPYDPLFDSTKNDESNTYYGASLSAINHLAVKYGYSLIEIGNSGINAFFIRNEYLTSDDIVLKPDSAFREKVFSDGSRPSHRWEKIKNRKYVDVSKLNKEFT